MKKETTDSIFKVGDTVYFYKTLNDLYDKKISIGVIEQIVVNIIASIAVRLGDGQLYYFKSDTKHLSFTYFDLESNTFSQERLLPEIVKGTPIFVRDEEDNYWTLTLFKGFFNEEDGPVYVEDYLGMIWDEYSLTQPEI